MEKVEDIKTVVYPQKLTSAEDLEETYESETDAVMEIKTVTYKNGNIVKKFNISSGKEVVIRELTANDDIEITRRGGKSPNQDETFFYTCSVSTKIDGEVAYVDLLKKLKYKDWSKIKYANSILNFL